MALDIDGFAVLRGIAAERDLFAEVATDAAKAARALVVKQITAKTTGLKSLHAVRKMLGKEAFGLILDGMADAQINALVVRLDKEHPELKTATPDWRRNHLAALAKGSIEPVTKPGQPKPSAKNKSKKEPAPELNPRDFVSFASAGAVRKR